MALTQPQRCQGNVFTTTHSAASGALYEGSTFVFLTDINEVKKHRKPKWMLYTALLLLDLSSKLFNYSYGLIHNSFVCH